MNCHCGAPVRQDGSDYDGIVCTQWPLCQRPKETTVSDSKHTLGAFLTEFTTESTRVLDLDVADFNVKHGGQTANIIIRYGQYTVVINPIPCGGYLDVDVHSFVKGEEAGAAVLGYTRNGPTQLQAFEGADTGLTSDGRPAVNLVALLVGKQS